MPSTSTSANMLWAADEPAASMAALGRPMLGRQQAAYELTTTSTTISPIGGTLNMLPDGQRLALGQPVGRQHLAMEQPDAPVTSLYAIEELGHWATDTRVSALIHALLASFSVILVSELGDKTFIITAIMAMKNSRSLVFLSSASALLVMTILSVGMGVAVTVIPEVYTHYASIVLFLCFGFKMLKESWDMRHNEHGESEFEEVKRSLEVEDVDRMKAKQLIETAPNHREPQSAVQPLEAQQGAEKEPFPLDETAPRWYSKVVQSLAIAPIVIKVFTMIFVAEWGDRSQISTVILAAREDSAGVFIGSLSGHVFCTGLAVIGGRFIADMISVRTMTLLGGIIFLLFAAFAILTGPGMSC